uniref:Venom protein n=1 Tax=Panagrellus redivivus TaxID=6233 RepID=A0A7E4VNE1_PANRE
MKLLHVVFIISLLMVCVTPTTIKRRRNRDYCYRCVRFCECEAPPDDSHWLIKLTHIECYRGPEYREVPCDCIGDDCFH